MTRELRRRGTSVGRVLERAAGSRSRAPLRYPNASQALSANWRGRVRNKGGASSRRQYCFQEVLQRRSAESSLQWMQRAPFTRAEDPNRTYSGACDSEIQAVLAAKDNMSLAGMRAPVRADGGLPRHLRTLDHLARRVDCPMCGDTKGLSRPDALSRHLN
ncbi:hypothetical protein NEOLEDRAFT_1132178 [Neolentinus lepideus HHB14362 ss-1]|uniref:Uncharacterized protein n=1 Tax=Neolentinus lepideus HHB14362 ss-1 TaxID=1314782 RepID=A0A165TGG3_9AGAM|nr:hypothetical protein NEOLEDRAFT_1132178 [Neolentinus lepideus HHB14362 ss-1]